MEISAQTIKQLRARTNAGVMDCKEALKEAGGDIEKAVDFLRKRGLAMALKRARRETGLSQLSRGVASISRRHLRAYFSACSRVRPPATAAAASSSRNAGSRNSAAPAPPAPAAMAVSPATFRP